MNFDLKALDLVGAAAEKCDLLVLLVPDAFKPEKDALSKLIAQARKAGDLVPGVGKLLPMYQVNGIVARHLLLVTVGGASVKDVRTSLNGLQSALKLPACKHAVICSTLLPEAAQHTSCIVQCIAELTYSFSVTKSQHKPASLQSVTIGVPDEVSARSGFELGQALAVGVVTAREWANRPANYATPTMLSQAAKEIAKQGKMQCTIHGPKEVAKLGMGSFMAVAQGSNEPLQFIEMHYQGASKSEAPVVLIGKGITFDTGGISLKPAAGMDEMKFDMGGAASVLGVFRALAQLRPAINVVGLIAACENMPDGKAVKPGDVVTSMSGQTIEILNTDAEGRLVLCDALTYADRFKPAAVVDIATLTGACVIALGGLRSGMYANDDALATSLMQAGDAAHDMCWRMPLDDEYAEGLKTNFADVANVAGRAAGSVTAAKFLQRFVGTWPWAHLDIAGTAWKEGASKGGTGRPVALLLHYLLSCSQTASAHAERQSHKSKPKKSTSALEHEVLVASAKTGKERKTSTQKSKRVAATLSAAIPKSEVK